MINLPYETIIKKIQENSELSEEDIKQKIDQKLKQLSGLISKEGAAHILANELGIKIFQAPKNPKIKDVAGGMRNLELSGKVQNIYEVREFKTEKGSGKVGSFTMADETGSIRVVCWHAQTDNIPQLKQNQIIKVIGGYIRENNNRKEIHLNERSKIIFNPEGVEIKEVKTYTNIPKKLSEIKENDDNIEVLATIVQVFDPRFFEVCPECGRRVKPREDAFFCEEHQKVKPAFSYVMNALLDDGTETVRTTFFGNQMERLINKSKEETLKLKDAPQNFEKIKTELLGKTIKIIGRTRKNEMFDRLEITARLVFPNIDPKEELEKLKATP